MTGEIDVLRRAMPTWMVRSNTAGMARDLGLPPTIPIEFAASTIDLNPDALNKLAQHIFGGLPSTTARPTHW